ncbi:hypothetical protein TFLX_04748 [Thermoflexales bacterium]|nr:hypothetical protein TFLX_04748 [Thermoflexales bacterium]
MTNAFIVFLLFFGGISAVVTLVDFWSNWRRYGKRIARRLVLPEVLELLAFFAMISILLWFGSAQGPHVMSLLIWAWALLLGAQIVSLILKQPKIYETMFDLGNPYNGVAQAAAFVFLGVYLLFRYLSEAPTQPGALPVIVVYVLSGVYVAARSVRNYYLTEEGVYTPTGKIDWEQVTVCQLDTAPDGAPVLYVQAQGGLPWRDRFAIKVAVKDKAALVDYLERCAPAGQTASVGQPD